MIHSYVAETITRDVFIANCHSDDFRIAEKTGRLFFFVNRKRVVVQVRGIKSRVFFSSSRKCELFPLRNISMLAKTRRLAGAIRLNVPPCITTRGVSSTRGCTAEIRCLSPSRYRVAYRRICSYKKFLTTFLNAFGASPPPSSYDKGVH